LRALVSARLGADFTKLWTASAVSTVGDGVHAVAGPLLIASISDNPALIAGGAFAGQLPWLLFGLVSGALVDRLDQRRLIVTVDLLRAAVVFGLAAAVATGTVTVPVVYAAVFLLGAGSTLAGTARGALLPAVVPPEQLPSANARLSASFTIGNQFAAKPLGAWLFVIAGAAPFALDGLTFAVAALLTAGIRHHGGPRPQHCPDARPAHRAHPDDGPSWGRALRHEIAEGVRWLSRHRLLRTLAVAMGLANVAFCAAFAVFVLYCRQRLGLSEVGYGLLLTAFAAGSLVGATVAARLVRTFGISVVLRLGLAIEAVVHLTLALTTTAWIAAAVLIIFSVHAVVWGITVDTLRQRVVPSHLLGRVGSAYALLDQGGAALGSLLGGLLAGAWTITTPFWAAGAAMVAVTALAWRPLRATTG
jgi:MFS family permease